ncbi:uncharacterized protein [Chironomus tepperi]|uniref:uncharacterized protein n=1 Tax=Chironomus tepperi TaxID=113505 RepID=UPI00391F7449
MSWTLFSLVVFAISVFQATLILAQDSDKNLYSKRYDNIDVETIFSSKRLLNNYVDCLLDKKPCPPEGKDLKRVLPHALRTRCARCTKLQKAKALDVITRLYYQHPSIYLSLAERYDPTGEYTKNFENWFDEQNSVKPRPPIPDFGNIPLSDSPSSEGQSPNRRSPSIGAESSTSINNLDFTQRTRIPSSWITTTTTTTQKPTTTRAPLRTTTGSRTTVKVLDKPSTIRAPPPPSTVNNPNFFLFPRPDGPISQSINKLLDTTDKLAVNFANMFKTTLEILAG